MPPLKPASWRNTPIGDSGLPSTLPESTNVDTWSPEAREAAAAARKAKGKEPGPFEKGISGFEGWMRNSLTAEQRKNLTPEKKEAMRKAFNKK
jgi:hypothetical protein